MPQPPYRVLTLFIPTIWIFFAFVGDSLGRFPWYFESFGDDTTFLDLVYEDNPAGIFLGSAPVRFEGHLIDEFGEHPLRGMRRLDGERVVYHFFTAGAEYLGELRAGTAGCEPELHFLRPAPAVLRAGFCP